MNESKLAPINLPAPSQTGQMSLEEAIARRRSRRHFTSEPVTLSELSQLLWATQGITDIRKGRRAIPSAGATFPLEIFVVCGSGGVKGMDAGTYHYHIASHSLTLFHEGDVRSDLSRAARDQPSLSQAPISIIICAEYERTSPRYGDRTARFVHMEVGHAGQNIYLQATALGLITVAIGAFDDGQVSEILRLDVQYKPLYLMPVGRASEVR